MLFRLSWLQWTLTTFLRQSARLAKRPGFFPSRTCSRFKDVERLQPGRVERGQIKVGESVEIVGIKDTTTTTITGVEMFEAGQRHGG